MSAVIEGCLNHYTKENIEQLFCESDDSMRVCENCPSYQYDARLGEIYCTKLNNLDKEM